MCFDVCIFIIIIIIISLHIRWKATPVPQFNVPFQVCRGCDFNADFHFEIRRAKYAQK